MAEACIGLALMAFTWIIGTYALFMAENKVRTAMAARYAAWYQGANGNGTLPTTAQIDEGFFQQAGVSTVTDVTPQAAEVPVLNIPLGFNDGTAANGMFKVQVTFGVSSLASANQYPFVLLNTQVPYMPSSALTNAFSVQSSCQWDGVGDTWTTAGQALSAIWNELKSLAVPQT